MGRTGVIAGLLLAAGGCTTTTADVGTARPLAGLPEAVRAAAAPYQDLAVVVLRPDDGCYWYRHAGPVETTFLPLRTRDDRPICARPPVAAPGQVAAPSASSAG